MSARLTIFYSDRPTRTFTAQGPGELILGRDPGCDVVLDDSRISRRHALLTVDSSGGAIEDLGSKNGVAVDGAQVERALLADGSWLALGGLIVRFETGETAVLAERDERRQAAQTLREHQALADPKLGVPGLVERLLSSFVQMSGADRGFVLLGSDRRFEVVASRGLSAAAVQEVEFAGSASVVRKVLAAGAPVIESQVSEGELPGARPSIVREGIRALVCLPLCAAGRVLGAVYADSRQPGKSFRELDVEILTALATHAALAMSAAGLNEDLEDLARGLPTRADAETPGLVPLPGYPGWTPSADPPHGGAA